jgi:hypothetical protein
LKKEYCIENLIWSETFVEFYDIILAKAQSNSYFPFILDGGFAL